MDKSEMLLLLIAVSGELQAEMAPYAVGSASYAAALVTKLKKDGWILARSRDGIKGYLLRAKGKKMLMERYPEAFAVYFSGAAETNHVKSEPERRLRLHRMSRAWAFFYRMGVPVFPMQKPSFPPDIQAMGKGRAYYGAAEFKGNADKVKGSRACGLLLCGGQPFVVYHTVGQRMKWAKKMERSMRQFAESVFWKQGCFLTADAAIIGNTMETLRLLLESDGGFKGNLFQVDDTYERWFYFSMQEESRIQLELVADKKTGRQFYAFLCQSLSRRRESEYALMDGYDREGAPVYFCYELELFRLMRIKHELGIRAQRGKVVCLDFQAEVLKAYFGEEVEVLAVLSEKVTEYLSACREPDPVR